MRVGQILKSKAGSPYIKIESDLTLVKGDALFLNKPQAEIDLAVERGKLTKEQGEAKKAKVPDFVIYNIILRNAPNETGVQTAEKF